MKLLDFLVFYLTAYFENNRKLLAWSSPLERAIYAIGITFIFWMITVWSIISFLMHIDSKIDNYKLIGLFIIPIGVIYLLQFIYDKKNRFNRIASSDASFLKLPYNKGVTLSVVLVLFSDVLPFILAVVFHILKTR